MDILTGDKNLDMEILMKLKDHELGPVCQANKYINTLCKTPIFWYNRMIKKIEESYQKNLKLNKNFKKSDINGKNLEDMKKYFGFESLQELNNFLNEFSINALYSLYIMYYDIIDTLSDLYVFDDTKFPKYINKEELMFYIRREFAKNYYKYKIGHIIDFPILYIKNNTPGFILSFPYTTIPMPNDVYEFNKSIGIRK